MFLKYDSKTQWFQDDFPGAALNLNSNTTVVILHTTESTSWPKYAGGATAPQVTLRAPQKHISRGEARQHFPFNRSGRALRNKAGGVETNTLNAIQVELIGTCDPKHKKSWNGEGKKFAGVDYIYWPEASDGQLKHVAKFLADMHNEFGLLLSAPREFLAYPGSYGENHDNRLTGAEWRKSRGVYGHQHVPENSHGDPGNIDIDKILKFAKDLVNEKKAPVGKKKVIFPNVIKASEYIEKVIAAEKIYPNKGLENAAKTALNVLKPYRK